LGAQAVEEIVFTRGATEAINLVAQTWGSNIITLHNNHHPAIDS
jgi:selenocysteine lyase/cysteine desulfurase